MFVCPAPVSEQLPLGIGSESLRAVEDGNDAMDRHVKSGFKQAWTRVAVHPDRQSDDLFGQ